MLADDDRVSRLGPHDFRLGTKRTAEYKRYTISCPFHPNCHRKRNAGPPQCAEFGRWETSRLLLDGMAGARRASERRDAQDRHTVPSPDAVCEWLQRYDRLDH